MCKTCTISSSNCNSCYSGYILTTNKSCFANCSSLSNSYDPITYNCYNCELNCETCFGPRYDQCLTCKNPLSLNGNTCVSRCPAGMYRDSNSVCNLCDKSKCSTC